MFCVLYSAVGSVLYLFGGSNYPESEECLDGLYAYDIGKTNMKHVSAFQPYNQNIFFFWLQYMYYVLCEVIRVSNSNLLLIYHSMTSILILVWIHSQLLQPAQPHLALGFC